MPDDNLDSFQIRERDPWTINEMGGMKITLHDEGFFEADLGGHKVYFGIAGEQDDLTGSKFTWKEDLSCPEARDGIIMVVDDKSYDLNNRTQSLEMFREIYRHLQAKLNAQRSREQLRDRMCGLLDILADG